MPAFAISAGGQLTDPQIDALVTGIVAWKDPAALPAEPIPAYAGSLGDVASGAEAFGVYCGSCHGADGKGGEKAGSVVNPKYLGMVSDQYLRTVTIAGRPELGCPDFARIFVGRAAGARRCMNVFFMMTPQGRSSKERLINGFGYAEISA